MAGIWCVGCGADLPDSRERVSFSKDSKRLPETRQKVLSALKELVQVEREKRNLAGTCSLPSSVKMCRSCFSAYKTYSEKKGGLIEKLQLAFSKTSFLTIDESTDEQATVDAPIGDEEAG